MVDFLVVFSLIFIIELCILEFYLEFFKPKKSFLYKLGKFLERYTNNYGFVEKFLGIK